MTAARHQVVAGLLHDTEEAAPFALHHGGAGAQAKDHALTGCLQLGNDIAVEVVDLPQQGAFFDRLLEAQVGVAHEHP